jgi:hypothetical protein
MICNTKLSAAHYMYKKRKENIPEISSLKLDFKIMCRYNVEIAI